MAAEWSVGREFRTIPGWAVYGQEFIDHKAGELLADSDTSVVVGSLAFMTSIGYRPGALWPAKLASPDSPDYRDALQRWKALLADSSTVHSASAHLGTLVTIDDSLLLETLSSTIDDDVAANELRLIGRLVSGDYADLVALAAAGRYLQQWKYDRLNKDFQQLKIPQLTMLLEGDSRKLRKAAAVQLATRGEFAEEVIIAALCSKDDDVIKVIFDAVHHQAGVADVLRSAIEKLKASGKEPAWQALDNDVPARILGIVDTPEALEARMAFDSHAWEARLYQQGTEGVSAARTMLTIQEDAWADILPASLRAALNDDKKLISFIYANRIAAAIRYLSQLPTPTHEDLI